ncbi:MAG: TrbG/VirB9 family P-type conjugative transfer protein [Sphingomonadales bacterium]|nr:TrbG/VirB9 family P-type conjugative transfer protein [Sphingomonadales bacterium]
MSFALVAAARAEDSAAPPSAEPAPPAMTTYRLSGAALLRPSRIGDDGVHTYIEWPEDRPLPAVFALNAHGDEEMVDGYMRGGLYTIDRINPRLVFRLDKAKAQAIRNAPVEARR